MKYYVSMTQQGLVLYLLRKMVRGKSTNTLQGARARQQNRSRCEDLCYAITVESYESYDMNMNFLGKYSSRNRSSTVISSLWDLVIGGFCSSHTAFFIIILFCNISND